MKKFSVIYVMLSFAFASNAQPPDCTLKPPQVTIHFGTGDIRNPNIGELFDYREVGGFCPTDGHYAFASYTGGCFRDDWHTLDQDHTAGDANGNMLLVNAAYSRDIFLRMPVRSLKGNTRYELGLWLINLCRPTKKCPFLLLPALHIWLETPEGKIVANIVTGEVPRVEKPVWQRHHAFFTTPASSSELVLVMSDERPGGCGNDFALDDITFRECVKQVKPATSVAKKTAPAKKPPATQKVTAAKKPETKKVTTATTPKKEVAPAQVVKTKPDTALKTKQVQKTLPPPPSILRTRDNALARRIETAAGDISIELYDNGDIDDDTVSIYHNNSLIKSHMRLSRKPISITIGINQNQPHHEIIMVAENLGSIPPNTSVMIINTAGKRYEVFISSTEQKNAKVVFDLK